MDIKLNISGIILSVLFVSGCYTYSPKNEMMHKATEYENKGFHQIAASMKKEAEELPDHSWAFGGEPHKTTVFYTPPPETGQYNFRINISTFTSNTNKIKIRRNIYYNRLTLLW
jgi:hypothetical protein